MDDHDGPFPPERGMPVGTPPIVRRAPRQSPAVFHRAAAVLMAKHHVTEYVAIHMLVEGAVDSGRTVRETARAIIMESSGTD